MRTMLATLAGAPARDQFFAAYVECALWSSTDDDDRPMDASYTADDIDLDTLATMARDCARFLDEQADLIEGEEERAGLDFWLTRNGHGAGFWDGDWPHCWSKDGAWLIDRGEMLTHAAHTFGEFTLYLGDDGRLYGMRG